MMNSYDGQGPEIINVVVLARVYSTGSEQLRSAFELIPNFRPSDEVTEGRSVKAAEKA